MFLVLCLFFGLMPVSVYAEAANTEVSNTEHSYIEDLIAGVAPVDKLFEPLDPTTVPEIVGYKNAVTKTHIRRLYDEEGDQLNKLAFLNADGTKTVYIYDYPVKYTDTNGSIKDITLNIAPGEIDGQFESEATSAKTVFSKKSTDGIILTGEGARITLVPHIPNQVSSDVDLLDEASFKSDKTGQTSSTAHIVDKKTVVYPYDAKTSIEYSLTYTGFKEDIVVTEYTGQSEYEFTLVTDGLELVEIDGSFYLIDEDKTIKSVLGDIIVITADEANNRMGKMTFQPIIDKQEYLITIHIDADYLSDKKTVYPIRIDPSIEICYNNNGANAISDVTLNSNSSSNPTSGSLFVGPRQTYGISRILMKFPGLNLSALGSNIRITSASVELRDLMCESVALDVYCYVFSGNEWNESTVGWDNVSPNSISTFLSTNSISYANGIQQATAHRYVFDITAAVEGWRTGNYNQNKGVIFKASSSVENGTSYNYKTIASYNRVSNKPSLSVTYSTTSNFLNNDTYYLNNRYCGDYLRYFSNAATASSGLISSLGNSIRWEIVNVEGGYVIRSKSDITKYLGVPSNISSTSVSIVTINDITIPSRCIWRIMGASGGGCLVQSTYNSKYLYSLGNSLHTSSSTGSTGTSAYDSKVWRIASQSFYGPSNISTEHNELSSFSVNNLTISKGQPINPNVTTTISSPMWTSASDFEYSANDCYTRDYRTGTITGANSGTYTIEAKHKVTNVTAYFSVTVNDTIISAFCLENSVNYIKYSVGNNSSALIDGITWASSNPSVATVSDNGVVTGNKTGYTFITATNDPGDIILMCDFKVTNERTQKLSEFGENEIQYLYCPSSYLNLWTQNLPNAFDFKVDLLYCLRTYYILPENEQPNGAQLKQILYNELNLTLSERDASYLFNECYLGYRGLYNPNYLNNLRKQYFNFLKQIVTFCAFSMSGNLDPVNTMSNCNGYDDLVNDLSKEWGHNENSSNVMLGSNGYQGKYYYIDAQKMGYRYFYSPDYDYYSSIYGNDFVRSVNIRFLQRCLESNSTFFFNTNPGTAPLTSSLHMEYSYLLNYYADQGLTTSLVYQSQTGFWFLSFNP